MQKNNDKKVPQLRFLGFDGDWEQLEFAEIASRSKEKHNPKKNKKNYPCIELESIGQGNGRLLKILNSVDQKSTKNKFKKGQVLYGKLRPYLKKHLLAPFEGVCSTEIWVLDPKTITDNFLYCLVQSKKFNDATNIAIGTKMPRADWNYVASTPLFFPSLPEQQKIANFLSSIEKQINLLEQKTEQLQAFKKGMIQQLLTGKKRFQEFVQEEGFKETKLGMIPKDWEVVKLKYVATILSGYPFKGKYFSNKGTRVLIPKNFTKSGRVNFTEANSKYTSEAVDNKYLCSSGDLMVLLTDLSKSCELLGKPIYLHKEDSTALLNQRIVKVVPDEKKTLNQYLMLFMLTKEHHEYMKKTSKGTTVQHSSNKILLDAKIPLPSLPEQKKIADCLSSIDQQIEDSRTQLEASKTYKKGLLQQLLV